MFEPALMQYNDCNIEQRLQLPQTNNNKCCKICQKQTAHKQRSRAAKHIMANNNNNNSTTQQTLNAAPAPLACHTRLSSATAVELSDSVAQVHNTKQSDHNNTTIFGFARHRCITMRRLCALLLICTLLNTVEGCGPGRGIGGPRRHRKLTPLVFKQHVPNMSERTLGASGLNEGVIKKNSPKFKDLVPNYNPDIIFKDDEGTGADRLMSRRCKEKLDILAVSVMNQWRTVRLRVIESWDADNAHHDDSLHYEGRAVDITTSDRDPSKYGMLARLAVEAGFDWVYYESRAHIHCSVKADSQQLPHVSGCFAADSSVLLESGERKSLRDLNIGERVLAMDAAGQPVYSEVILFMDRNLEQVENFVQIHTVGGATLTVTPAHLVLVWHPTEHRLEYMFADRVQENDYVLVHDQYGRLSPQRVQRLKVAHRSGVVAPLTRAGTIVVDSVTASCYAVVNSQKLAHWGLAPMRLMASMRSWLPGSNDVTTTTTPTEQAKSVAGNSTLSATSRTKGIHWYARFLYALKDIVLPQQWRYQ
ncbi:protein hedgehog [Zeugodacus cucurbitae]|uniref:Hedgehog protein n=1 Tax=Zeugodacus cucurbitae TaxID=28588 RepID=A0A0A1WD26_ZEUCU|nr:protein hedgehog [Zeugodacus cucurbitae]